MESGPAAVTFAGSVAEKPRNSKTYHTANCNTVFARPRTFESVSIAWRILSFLYKIEMALKENLV